METLGGLNEGSIKGRGKGRRPSRSTDSPFRPRELGRGDILAHRVCRPGFGASASEKTAGPPAKRIEFCELYKSIHSSLLRRIDGTLEFLLPKRILLSFSSSSSCETRIRSNQRLLSIDILSKYLIFVETRMDNFFLWKLSSWSVSSFSCADLFG